MNWRIYRLPGSRRLWHIDAGPGTVVINVYAWQSQLPVYSVDIGNGMPRAWVEIRGAHLLISKTFDGCGYKAPELAVAQFVSDDFILKHLAQETPQEKVDGEKPEQPGVSVALTANSSGLIVKEEILGIPEQLKLEIPEQLKKEEHGSNVQ